MQFDSGRYRENDGNWRWSEHNTILIQVYGTDMARNWLYKNIIVGITAGNSVCKHVNGISMHKSASNTYAYLILCVPPCCRMILARQLKLQRMQNCYHRIANDHFMFMFFVCVSVDCSTETKLNFRWDWQWEKSFQIELHFRTFWFRVCCAILYSDCIWCICTI